ncbi:kinase-like domain-containing protein [Mycena rosella]|uniref:Kinase-like domain-containing protein n=1 Tax=Mycena rosella TaxID=1033263 RepID=A0AAD7DHM2_MYCRO|nr:kinase-like domain-containing protein [Mycena rosella]
MPEKRDKPPKYEEQHRNNLRTMMLCSPVLPGPLSGSIDSAPPTLEDVRLDGMERKLHDLSPPELGRKFELLIEQHVYSANMKRVIKGFNLEALQAQATQSMGKRCTGCYLTDQGGYNTVGILTFDDGPDIIARLSGSHTGQDDAMSLADLEQRFISEASRLRITAVRSITSAQVATLRYVKKKTTIPVPEVYHAIPTADNPVGARYMLMQKVPGQVLLSQWTQLSVEGRQKVITQLADFQAQLLSLEFPTIGCLIDENGTVGPLGLSCTYPFALRNTNRGPFSSSKDFLLAHVNAELDLLTNHAADWTERRTTWAACNGGFDDLPATYAIQWFRLLLDGITALPSDLLDPPESPFVLFHDDFNEGNVLVSYSDPTQVVGIIDWEGSRISPVWDPRRLCSVLRHDMVDDPDEFASLKEMQTDILQDAQLYTAYSKLHLARLLHITDYSHSVQSTRSHLDGLFMEWFDGDSNGVDNKVQNETGETT